MRAILISVGIIGVFLALFITSQRVGSSGKTNVSESATPAAEVINTSPTPTVSASPSPETEASATPTPSTTEQETVITTPSGLQYVDLQEGTGAIPQAGQVVTVHYTGTLENGTKFDSSYDRNRPFQFKLGAGQVIKGWDEGLATMKVGSKRKLIIPPDLGYGSRPVGPIPANSTLIFEVELLSISP
jgi:peptidylprolyl isomerase